MGFVFAHHSTDVEPADLSTKHSPSQIEGNAIVLHELLVRQMPAYEENVGADCNYICLRSSSLRLLCNQPSRSNTFGRHHFVWPPAAKVEFALCCI